LIELKPKHDMYLHFFLWLWLCW